MWKNILNFIYLNKYFDNKKKKKLKGNIIYDDQKIFSPSYIFRRFKIMDVF